MQKKIIIFTHNPIRDPITDDCLSVALKKKGHLVWKRNYLEADKIMVSLIKPDIIIVPEIRCEYTRDFVKQCKEWGCQIVVRPCEVGISEESIEKITDDYKRAIFGGNCDAGDYIDLMLCWGDKMKEMFSEHAGLPEEKLVVVGGIAFDQFFIPPPPVDVQRTEKKRVMFATGFAYADRNPEYSMPEAKENDPIHAEIVKTDLIARSKWFEIIRMFVNEHGDDWEVWVKLHPGERIEPYQAILKGIVTMCPNVPPVMALEHVDLVVHAGSTMAYEAHLKGKPAINLNNICQDIIVSSISPNVNGFQELSDCIRNIRLNESNADEKIIDILEKHYYGTVDGKASERSAEAISLLPDTETQIPDQWPQITEMRYETDCVLKNVEQWHCSGCNNRYFVKGPREMVKCPFCGIANVKMAQPTGG